MKQSRRAVRSLGSDILSVMSAELVFQVLGSVSATRDGRPVDLGGPRQRSVLARLLVADGRAVSAESLVADLWREDLQPRAIALLQAHVSLLRRVLEPARAPRTPATVLVTEPPGYALRAGGAVDALQLVELMAQGDHSLPGDPVRAAARFEAASALWRGPAYAEFADEPWASAEIHRLEELRLTLVERRAAAYLELGDHPAAVRLLQPQVADHPLRESAWRLLALGLYRSGRQGDALAALRSARDRLADELGIDPGPELRQLENDILTQAPQLTARRPAGQLSAVSTPAAASQLSAAPASPVSAALIGRDDEVRLLTDVAHRAAGTSLQVALVSAEAGGGKTALLDAVVRQLPGWTSCLVRCPETDGAPSGWPWIEALQTLSRTHPPTDRQRLAPWLESGGESDAGSGDEVRSRFQVHRAVATWLSAVAADTPMLLVLDDLHRADDETVTLLADLVAALQSAAVFVLIGHRPESTPELTRTLAILARFAPTRLELAGLTATAVDELVDELAMGQLDGPARASIFARTAGNPFFVRELVRLLGTGADVEAVPDGIRDVVRQRLAALPAQSGTLLRIAAVGGREMSVDALLEAGRSDPSGPADDESLVDALELGVVSGLLTEPAPGRVRFSHAIVRDTLYSDLTSLRAGRWHARMPGRWNDSTPAM